MYIIAVVIYAVFAQAGAIPQNPQAQATRVWLDRQADNGADKAAMAEAAQHAVA